MKHHIPLHECNYICITYTARLVQISKSSLTVPFIFTDYTENRYHSANIETAYKSLFKAITRTHLTTAIHMYALTLL